MKKTKPLRRGEFSIENDQTKPNDRGIGGIFQDLWSVAEGWSEAEDASPLSSVRHGSRVEAIARTAPDNLLSLAREGTTDQELVETNPLA